MFRFRPTNGFALGPGARCAGVFWAARAGVFWAAFAGAGGVLPEAFGVLPSGFGASALAQPARETAAAGQSDLDRVQNFLSRLGLADLQIKHLEGALPRAADKAKLDLARRLADLYAEQLMAAGEDKAKYEALLAKIAALLREAPTANTPALQVMLLQADYQRAETLLLKWLSDPDEAAALSEGRDILTRVAPELARRADELRAAADEAFKNLPPPADNAPPSAEALRAGRLEAVALRARYFSGWASYFFGVSRQDATAGQPDFSAARDAFRVVLGVLDDEKYPAVDPANLNLENRHRARAVVGLGLAEIALGDLEGAKACFKWLDHISAPPGVRDEAPTYFLQGLLSAGRTADALRFAEDEVKKFAGAATQGKVDFCLLLTRRGVGRAAASAEDKKMGELGVRGFAQLREFDLLAKVLEERGAPIGPEAGFHLTWIKGRGEFLAAEKSKQPAAYQAAAATLAAALEKPDAKSDAASAARCRYWLGWSRFRLQEYEAAARQFQQAIAGLKAGDNEAALDSAWMVFAAYHQLARQEPRFATQAVNALRVVKSDFPGSDKAKQADLHIARLQKASRPEDTLKALQAIEPDNPGYLASRHEWTELLYRQWRADNSADAAKQLPAVVNEYVAALRGRSGVEPRQTLQVLLWGVDAALNGPQPNMAQAEAWLKQGEPLAASLNTAEPIAAEWRYRALQLAQKQSQPAQVAAHSAWLADHAAGTPFELQAVLLLASAADAQAKAAPAGDVEAKREAVKRFRRLAALLGESSAVLAENKNARVAVGKLVQYELELQEHAAAAPRAEQLVAAFPTNRVYLRQAGLALFHTRQFARALEHWRTLLQGLPQDGEDWCEAKYHQLACLAALDPPAARKVRDQFRLLHPRVKFDHWRVKFEELDKQLGG